MNLTRHFDKAEMTDFEETITIYNDFGETNMNLISQIQQQIKNILKVNQ